MAAIPPCASASFMSRTQRTSGQAASVPTTTIHPRDSTATVEKDQLLKVIMR